MSLIKCPSLAYKDLSPYCCELGLNMEENRKPISLFGFLQYVYFCCGLPLDLQNTKGVWYSAACHILKVTVLCAKREKLLFFSNLLSAGKEI